MSVTYKNAGHVTWLNLGHGVSDPTHIELRSVDGGCGQLNGALEHSSWINAQRIGAGPPLNTPVAPGSSWTFAFTAQAPAATGDYPQVQWVAPWAASECVDGWAGVNFTVRVDGTPPGAPGTPSVVPGGCAGTNSFSFNWGAG